MNYICKIATKEEIEKEFDYEIMIHPGNDNWKIWKEQALEMFGDKRVCYIGILNGEVICEATAALSPDACQNSKGLVDDKTAYLFAFRTKEKYRKQGYFSKLFKFMIDDLKNRGYEKVTLGVEPNEIENKQIYAHYGFNEYIKNEREVEPDGNSYEVEYYGKYLR